MAARHIPGIPQFTHPQLLVSIIVIVAPLEWRWCVVANWVVLVGSHVTLGLPSNQDAST